MLWCTADRRTIRQGSSKGSWLSVLPQWRAEMQFCPTLGQLSGFKTQRKISAGSYFEVYERTLWLSHASFLVLSNTFFRLLWDLNQMKTERLCSLSWFILAFFFTSLHTCARTDDIEEEMPLTSHTQGFAAQVNRLRSSVRVGMATTFLIVSFIFLLQFSFEQWPVEATRCLESSLDKLHMRLLISPLIRRPYLYYLLNKRNPSKQVESCWRYKSMGSGAV